MLWSQSTETASHHFPGALNVVVILMLDKILSISIYTQTPMHILWYLLVEHFVGLVSLITHCLTHYPAGTEGMETSTQNNVVGNINIHWLKAIKQENRNISRLSCNKNLASHMQNVVLANLHHLQYMCANSYWSLLQIRCWEKKNKLTDWNLWRKFHRHVYTLQLLISLEAS